MGTGKGTARGRVAPRMRPRLASANAPEDVRDPDTPDLQRQVAAHWLTFAQARYDETRNPVFVWEAWNTAHEASLPIPAWVTAYFCRVSNELHQMSRSTIPQKAIAPAVYRAFEFNPSSKKNPFREIANTAHDVGVACEVLFKIQQDTKLDFAIVDVVKEHPIRCSMHPPCESLSRSTVARCWRTYGPRLLDTQPRRLPFTLV
jgi:hypothetical protein